MDMNSVEDFSCSKGHLMILKGKRTKRPRPPSPLTQGATSISLGGGESSCTSNCISPDIASRCCDPCPILASKTPTNNDCDESSDSTLEEDEDMANCLILLAQSGGCVKPEEKQSTKRLSEIVSNSTTKIKSEIFVYDCRTCNRNFPSFQALGGHRASHKKPKILVDDKKPLFTSCDHDHDLDDQEQDGTGGKFISLSDDYNPCVTVPLAIKVLDGNINKSKIHMCSICGSEFSSGQALGGHMRRHRNVISSKDIIFDVKHVESEVPRRIFTLDLNLPAPEDDQRDLKFQFAVDQKHLVSTSPALVDCHY